MYDDIMMMMIRVTELHRERERADTTMSQLRCRTALCNLSVILAHSLSLKSAIG